MKQAVPSDDTVLSIRIIVSLHVGLNVSGRKS